MYNLYINDEYITQVSSFNEFLETKTPDKADKNPMIGLIFEIRQEEIPENFNIELFRPFLNDNAIQNIVLVTEEERKIVYQSKSYSQINSVKWGVDDFDNKRRVVISLNTDIE